MLLPGPQTDLLSLLCQASASPGGWDTWFSSTSGISLLCRLPLPRCILELATALKVLSLLCPGCPF